MPTYQIQAPNGQTYQIPGPDGATQEDIQAEVMRQHPEAAQPAQMTTPTAEVLRDRPESTWAATPRPAEVGEIRAAPTFMEGVGQGLKSVAKEVLPLAGMVGGGILGTPVGGPIGTAAGGIGGYVLGKQANDTIETLFNYLTGQPVRPASEIPGRFAGQVGEGVTIEAGGQVLSKAGGLLSEILRDSGVMGVPAVRAPLIAAADRVGVEMPASAVTGSRFQSKLEAAPQYFAFGADDAARFFDRTALSAQRAGERLAEMPGPRVGLEQAGRSIQQDVGSIARAQEDALAGLRAGHEAESLQGAQAVAARDQALAQGGQESADALVNTYLGQFGPGRTMGPAGELAGTQLGTELQAALDAAQTEARGRIAPLYQGVREEISAAGSHVPMTSTKEVADRILGLEQRMTGLGRSGVSRPAGTAADIATGPIPEEIGTLPATMQESIIRQLGLDQGRAIEPDLALELSKRLQAAARNAPDDITRRALNELRGAIEQDLGAWANVSGTNVGPLRQQAAQAYREQIVPYFSESAPLRKQLMDVEPEKAAQKLLSMRDPQLIQDAMRFLPPEAQNRLRASVLGGLPRDPAGFEQGVARYSEDALQALLGPEGVQALGQMRQQLGVGQAAMESNRVFGQTIGAAEQAARQAAFDRNVQAGFGRGTTQKKLASIGDDTGSAADVVTGLTLGKYKSLEDFDAVWQAVSPETQREIRSASLGRLVDQAKNKNTDKWSPEVFTSRLADVPPAIWQRMLGADERAFMADMKEVLQQINVYARSAANPSGTGQARGSTAQLAALGGVIWATASGQQDPTSAAAEIALITSPQWGGKLLYSRAAQNFLKRPGRAGGIDYSPLSRFLGIELTPDR